MAQIPGAMGGSNKPCARCEERDQVMLEHSLGLADPSGHVYAQVRRSTQGSPTRFKGKRETMPSVPGMGSFDLRPANAQLGMTTGFNQRMGAPLMQEDDFNTMVVLQPSVSSAEIRAKI